MIELYLLRHGEAEPQRGFEDDASRHLTEAGRTQIQQLSEYLKELGMQFDCIISSPFDRTLETARLIETLNPAKKEISTSQSLTPNAGYKDILKELKSISTCRRILLVGHMPHLGQLTSFLISGGMNVQVVFQKGGMARIDYESSSGMGTLVWLTTPTPLAHKNRV